MKGPKKNLKLLLESTIQCKIIRKMTTEGWLVVKIIQTNRNGWPDLQCHKNGKTLFIECKSKKGKLSKLQQYIHQILKQQGFEVLVLDNIP